jgi:vacuolar-type H+-ATPase subunit I/STV1
MAEALKSEIYLFRSNTPPYDTDNKPEKLIENAVELLKKVEDLPTEIISEAQRQESLPTKDLTVEEYIEERVNDKINTFYRPRSDELKRKMKRNKDIGLSLGVFAIVLGALGLTGWTAGWIAVISTIAASITAFAYAGRYQYLIISYQTTADKLERLRASWESKGKVDNDTDERSKFIRECERVISIENSAWMVEMAK